jgi:hypothetical protein
MTATVSLVGRGQISVQAVQLDDRDFTASITGGTGAFQNARGELHVHFARNGDDILTFHLIP